MASIMDKPLQGFVDRVLKKRGREYTHRKFTGITKDGDEMGRPVVDDTEEQTVYGIPTESGGTTGGLATLIEDLDAGDDEQTDEVLVLSNSVDVGGIGRELLKDEIRREVDGQVYQVELVEVKRLKSAVFQVVEMAEIDQFTDPGTVVQV